MLDKDQRERMVQRLARELAGARCVGLGPGIPLEVVPFLSSSVRVVRLDQPQREGKIRLDVVALEAEEVSQRGDLCVNGAPYIDLVVSDRWIVIGSHNRENGEPRILKSCRSAVSRLGCVKKVITELGVIEVTDFGLVLTEIAPGEATDDVKKRTFASLHVADDIRVMEFS